MTGKLPRKPHRLVRRFFPAPASSPSAGTQRLAGAPASGLGTVSAALTLVLFLPVLAACEREERSLRLDPPVEAALDKVAAMSNGIGGATPNAVGALGNPYETNAWSLSQGKRLYTWFNCKGCHGDGGGTVGPAFLDGWWRYGPDPVSIFLSIREGRPHGMPAYRDKLTVEQIWQLVGYVKSIGAYSGATAFPGRNDEMFSRPPENRAPAASARLQPAAR